jgi:hypothetical protein
MPIRGLPGNWQTTWIWAADQGCLAARTLFSLIPLVFFFGIDWQAQCTSGDRVRL